MSHWGKIFGTAAGLACGGPIGGLVGFLVGKQADNKDILTAPKGGWIGKFKALGAPDPANAVIFGTIKTARIYGQKDIVSGLGTLALSAKLARIDAPINQQEIDSVKTMFQVRKEQLDQLGKLFDTARQKLDDHTAIAKEIYLSFKNETQELEKILAVLFMVAKADCNPGTQLKDAELTFLKEIWESFHLTNRAWETAQSGVGNYTPTTSLSESYSVLGVKEGDDITIVRTKWKTLMRKYHPDTIKSDLPETEKEQIFKKAQQINSAWDTIRKAKGQ